MPMPKPVAVIQIYQYKALEIPTRDDAQDAERLGAFLKEVNALAVEGHVSHIFAAGPVLLMGKIAAFQPVEAEPPEQSAIVPGVFAPPAGRNN